MFSLLGPLNAIAAQRGDGLLPEFARLWQHSEAGAAAVREANAAVLYDDHNVAQPARLAQHVSRNLEGGSVVALSLSPATQARTKPKASTTDD
jgi:hypothetical protein